MSRSVRRGAGTNALVVLGIIAVFIVLGAIIWARLRTRKGTQVVDPQTPSDDPSKGMTGHD